MRNSHFRTIIFFLHLFSFLKRLRTLLVLSPKVSGYLCAIIPYDVSSPRSFSLGHLILRYTNILC